MKLYQFILKIINKFNLHISSDVYMRRLTKVNAFYLQ